MVSGKASQPAEIDRRSDGKLLTAKLAKNSQRTQRKALDFPET
jgi:hypothetical protein